MEGMRFFRGKTRPGKAHLFYSTGKFLSCRIKKTIMRTRAKGVYCLTANALGAGVRQGAHFLFDRKVPLSVPGFGAAMRCKIVQRFAEEPRKDEGVDGSQRVVENTEKYRAGKRQNIGCHIDRAKGVKD